MIVSLYIFLNILFSNSLNLQVTNDEIREKIDFLMLQIESHEKSSRSYNEIVFEIDNLSRQINYDKGIQFSTVLKINKSIHDGDYEMAERLINENLKLNKNTLLVDQEIKYYKSLIYYFKADFSRSKQSLIKYLNEFKNNVSVINGLAYNLLGAIYFKDDDFVNSISQYLNATKNFDAINSKEYLLSTYSQIAFISLQLNDVKSALKYAKLSIEKKVLEKIHNKQSIGILKSNAASIYLSLGNLNEAEKLLDESKRIFVNLKDQKYNLHNNIRYAFLFLSQNKLKKATNILNQISTNKEKNLEIEALINYLKAEIYFRNGKNREAISYFDKVINELKKVSVFELNKEEILKKCMICYHKNGDSLNYYKSKSEFLQLQFKKNKNELFFFDQYRNEMKIKDLENEKLLEITKNKNKNLIITVVVVFLTILLVVIFYSYQKKKKHNMQIVNKNAEITTFNNQLIVAQEDLKKVIEEKNILLKEVHHRVKNNLQLIASLLNLQLNEENEVLKEVLGKSQIRINSIALIHEKLYRSTDFRDIKLEEYFKEIVTIIHKLYFHDKKNIKIDFDVTDECFDIDVVVPLGLILNELITNSFKHAFVNLDSGFISIVFQKVAPNDYQLIIKDNGVGFEIKSDNDTLGLQLVDVLSSQLNGSLKITSSKSGTISIVKFMKS